MVLPLLLLAGGGAAALAGKLVNDNTKKKELKASALQASAVQQQAALILEWDKEKASFTADIVAKRDGIEAIHGGYEAQCEAVFDRLGHPTESIADLPLPPGMAEAEAITVQPLVAQPSIDKDAEFEVKLRKDLTVARHYALSHHRGDPLQQGGDFALYAGLAVLKSALSRDVDAEKSLTYATELIAEFHKSKAKVDGRTTTNKYLMYRAGQQLGKVEELSKFVERYATRCEGHIRAGKTRQSMTDADYLDVKYLARAMWSLTEEARKPLT